MSNNTLHVSHFKWRDILEPKEGITPETIEALDQHFSRYAGQITRKAETEKAAIEDVLCLKCGSIQNTPFGALLGVGFEWGVVHGEGRCRKCHWPATLYHFIKDKNGKEVITLRGILLQYHPDYVTNQESHE